MVVSSCPATLGVLFLILRQKCFVFIVPDLAIYDVCDDRNIGVNRTPFVQ